VTTQLLDRPAEAEPSEHQSGSPARRAMLRWAWRLFRRDWRQQILVLALIAVAVAATIMGAAVATNTPPPADAGFGTANHLVTIPGPDAHLAADLAAMRRQFGAIDVIENESASVPGSVGTVDVRAQDPHGPFGSSELALLSGRYPSGTDEVALTPAVASSLDVSVGGTWQRGSQTLRVVGLVENPQNLADAFALVPPGQVASPTQVNVLFDGQPRAVASFRFPPKSGVQTPGAPTNGISPALVVLIVSTFGLLFIGLVSVAGFSVMAQRRLRAIGMLGALGATDRHVRLVMIADGALVGVAATIVGAAVGLGSWFVYRPGLESSAGHRIGTLDLPWWLIVTAMLLAVVTATAAARYPARAAARLPIVAALSGRPPRPKARHRSIAISVALLFGGFFLIALASPNDGNSAGGPLEVLVGIVTITVGGLFLAPFAIAGLASLGGRAPIPVRVALRDLARYRSRSGAALGAITFAIVIAVVTTASATARYSDVLDYVAPNLSSNELVVYPSGNGPNGPNGPPGETQATQPTAGVSAQVSAIGNSFGTNRIVALQSTSATLLRATPGPNNFFGQVYVATPELLAHYGIKPSDVDPSADILTSRAGLDSVANLLLVYGNYFGGSKVFQPGSGGDIGVAPCQAGSCVRSPKIQFVSNLPAETSGPNVVITEHAIAKLNLRPSIQTSGWLIQTAQPLTAVQINNARRMASNAGMAIETANDQPSLAELDTYSTVAGMALALGVLAMTVGLIRSETAGDLRILAATGASRRTRRTITATTSAALALLGAVLGTAIAYFAMVAFFRTKLATSLGHIPVESLLVIIVGLPIIAAIGGWLLAGREPSAMARQPID